MELRPKPDEDNPELSYNLAEAIQLAFFYCARQLEWRKQMLTRDDNNERTGADVRDSFEAML